MNVPPELKSIAPYLQRAKEIKVKSQVVAYFCLTYAIKKGIELKASSPESRTFLSELMDRAEKVIGLKEQETFISQSIKELEIKRA